MYHDQGHIPLKVKGFVYNKELKKWDAVAGVNVKAVVDKYGGDMVLSCDENEFKAGAISGDDIVVNFKNLNRLDENRRYVLPVSITDAGIGVLESARTTYFIIKGAALINVVANIRENYLPVKWKDDNAMRNVKVITVEALVRSNDWEAERTNAISTIFGVEGKYDVSIRHR